MQYKLKIMKFGGAALKNKQSIEKLTQILLNYNDNSIICVISAFGKTTSILKNAAYSVRNNKFADATKEINHLQKFYENFFDGDISIGKKTNVLFDELKGLLKGISITGELTKKTLDKFLSYGELISSLILENQLKNTIKKTKFVDSSELIITDSCFGNANPDIKASYKLINDKLPNLLENGNLIIIPGFTAVDKNDSRTTMGMESSNLTAIILAEALKINEITFWTDVEGIRSSDPKLFQNTMPVKFLSYEQAQIAAYSGLKLVYSDMIKFSKKRKVRLIYKSLQNPDGNFTEISNKKGNTPILIIDNHYSLNDNSDIDLASKQIISAMGRLFYRTNSEKSKYSLITIIIDNYELKQLLLLYLHNYFKYIKFEVDSGTISVLLENALAIETASEMHQLITTFCEKD